MGAASRCGAGGCLLFTLKAGSTDEEGLSGLSLGLLGFPWCLAMLWLPNCGGAVRLASDSGPGCHPGPEWGECRLLRGLGKTPQLCTPTSILTGPPVTLTAPPTL